MSQFIAIAAFICTFLSGSAASWYVTRNHYQAELSNALAVEATSKAAAQTQALKRLAAANKSGNELSARLAATESALSQKNMELSHAVTRFTTGRPCLDGRAVRLLNSSANSAGIPMPEATITPDASDGASATDTDVAEWIGHAQGQHETCRARLDALIDFEEGMP